MSVVGKSWHNDKFWTEEKRRAEDAKRKKKLDKKILYEAFDKGGFA